MPVSRVTSLPHHPLSKSPCQESLHYPTTPFPKARVTSPFTTPSPHFQKPASRVPSLPHFHGSVRLLAGGVSSDGCLARDAWTEVFVAVVVQTGETGPHSRVLQHTASQTPHVELHVDVGLVSNAPATPSSVHGGRQMTTSHNSFFPFF